FSGRLDKEWLGQGNAVSQHACEVIYGWKISEEAFGHDVIVALGQLLGAPASRRHGDLRSLPEASGTLASPSS
ncbi:MAG: hypothetical protein QF437_23665, partial [Planctomycetota bacterium]|nr:hypothetical protein [Planctomycetota bacterium]